MELPITALLDANILYPAPVRDLFIRLAQAGLIRAKWSDAIHDEWIRSVLKNLPQLSLERLDRTRSLMNEAVRDSLVSGHEALIETLTLPDPDDRHVLAAAIHAEADVIATFNLKDFPPSILAAYGVEAKHPDDFLVEILESTPEIVCATFKRQREALRNLPKSAEELLATLEAAGLTRFVVQLRAQIEIL